MSSVIEKNPTTLIHDYGIAQYRVNSMYISSGLRATQLRLEANCKHPTDLTDFLQILAVVQLNYEVGEQSPHHISNDDLQAYIKDNMSPTNYSILEDIQCNLLKALRDSRKQSKEKDPQSKQSD